MYAPGSKAAQRQEELSRQVREREQELANLQERRDSRLPPNAPDAPSLSAEVDSVIASKIERLQTEMQRLHAQQQQMILEMNGVVPPPEYS